MNNESQYMVDFTLPDVLTAEFMDLIPKQRATVSNLFVEGKLAHYMLAIDDGKLWAVFNANSEYDVMSMIADLPLTPYMQVKISMLTFHNAINSDMPAFSLN